MRRHCTLSSGRGWLHRERPSCKLAEAGCSVPPVGHLGITGIAVIHLALIMIIERPDRISHGDDVPIYCLDASEGRLATGGGDGRVRLWATSVLMDSDASFTDVDGDGKDAGGGAGAARATAAGDGAAEGAGSEADQLDASRTLLSVLVGHDAPISCVRWSPSEVYLASGSDDGAVLLWERNQGLSYASAAFGGAPDAGKQGTENWSRVTNLRGHTADVCDIAWAPDGLVLASCSIDNHVLIWAAPGHPLWSTAPTQSPMRQLRGHKGWVKGACASFVLPVHVNTVLTRLPCFRARVRPAGDIPRELRRGSAAAGVARC